MAQLKDPLKNRVVKQCPIPYQRSILRKQLFKGDGIDWKVLRTFLKRQGTLKKELLKELLDKGKQILRNEPNIVKLRDPVTIVGDIHGQFYDLVGILDADIGGDPSSTKYLFLGDYVDRGNFSVQVMILVLGLKINFPKTIFLLRGNHETKELTSFFNFRKQCLVKYDQHIYEMFLEVFQVLPLCAIINNKFLGIHGGISHNLSSLNDIAKIDRFQQIPRDGIFCDILWADPIDTKSGQMNQLVKPNHSRGCSYYFGKQVSKSFLKQNKLLCIIRAHEAQASGYKMHTWFGDQNFPAVITVFSAPNYCDFYNNKGAIMKMENNGIDIQQLIQKPHPYHLPDFADVFQWSVPFLAQKITHMLYYIIKPHKRMKDSDQMPLSLKEKANVVQTILQTHKIKTEENSDLMKLNGRILDSHLVQDKNAREYTKKIYRKHYDKKKEIDAKNELRPT